MGQDNAGYWANLYYFNECIREPELQSASRIAADGTAAFAFDHASDYAIVIDEDSHEPVELPFTDVSEGHWAYEGIAYVYGHGLMSGTNATTFSPGTTTNRAMIAAILWRMAGSPVVDYLMDFHDVVEGQWYTEAVRWAASQGVMGGTGDGSTLSPQGHATRAQAAVMLMRFCELDK